jgi:hypothetical protein
VSGLVLASADWSIIAKSTKMATTTSNSVNVKARRFVKGASGGKVFVFMRALCVQYAMTR